MWRKWKGTRGRGPATGVKIPLNGEKGVGPVERVALHGFLQSLQFQPGPLTENKTLGPVEKGLFIVSCKGQNSSIDMA